jgi:hypothetical protein
LLSTSENLSTKKPRVTFVVTLTIRQDAAVEFEHYERSASVIMARYGGSIERKARLRADNDEAAFREVHIVTFRDHDSLESYRQDPELIALERFSASAVAKTEISAGRNLALR